MHILFEEDGAIKVATILTDNTTSLQVEAPHGKRSKIKAANVLLRFDDARLGDFMERANALAADIDVDFLWEVAGTEDFGFQALAEDYYGHKPSPVEAAAAAVMLHGHPMYFYKRGKGQYRPAPADTLKAAKAAEERKRQQALQIAEWVAEMGRNQAPEAIRKLAWRLVTNPDRNSLEYKAAEQAAAASRRKLPQLLIDCGAIGSAHEYHLKRFLDEYFPDGEGFPELAPFALDADLPLAEVAAFSIDDAATTEIDDAFSVTWLDGARFRLGIHIAAPGLIPVGSPWDAVAGSRLSTVYMPGSKITMLPEQLVEVFTLAEGRACPALSLYATVAKDGFAVEDVETRLERVPVKANLRIDALETVFNSDTVNQDGPAYPFRDELTLLFNFACHLEIRRGKADQAPFRDYSFDFDGDRVVISERRRGSPIDKLVSELMIFANARWGAQLAAAGVPAIYRVQKSGKTRMTVEPGPHQGLGVDYYTWSTSPLRRAADLANQRQLMALAGGYPPPYAERKDALTTLLRDFELAYDAYADFQRRMERYWCFRYMQQENLTRMSAAVIKENLVRFDQLPIVTRVDQLPEVPPGSRVLLDVSQMDFIDLEFACRFIGRLEAGAAE